MPKNEEKKTVPLEKAKQCPPPEPSRKSELYLGWKTQPLMEPTRKAKVERNTSEEIDLLDTILS